VIRDGLPFGGNDVQIALIAIEVLRSLTQGFFPNSVPSRRQAHQIASLLDGFLPNRVSGQRQAFQIEQVDVSSPGEYLLTLVDGRRVTYTISFKQTGITKKLPELNPYRPTIPTEIWNQNEILGRFLREQTEILRQQHNKTQAGDSTFPWELLTRNSDLKQYNLGSLGRFFHPLYGVIHARYVKFSTWVDTPAPTTPVGLLAGAESQDWVVTNDFSLSRSDLVLGVVFVQNVPALGTFGWVVTEGANPLAVQALGIPARVNEPYTWAGDGFLQAGGVGTVVGTRRPNRDNPLIAAGEFYIDVKGLSDDSILAIVQPFLDEAAGGVVAAAGKIIQLELEMDQEQAATANFTVLISTLTNRLTNEEQTRSEEIDRIDGLLSGGAVTQAQLTSAIAGVTIAYGVADAALSLRIDTAQARADSAYAIAAAIDSDGIATAISGLTGGLTDANSRIQAIEVAGAYPPQLGFMGW
jgi:hypothetical protein